MKGAIILLLILLMGFLTAQSLEAYGYTINVKDTLFLQNVYNKIDSLTIDQTTMDEFATYLDYFPTDSREHILLQHVYDYTQGHIDFAKNTPSSSDDDYTKTFIELLGQQF